MMPDIPSLNNHLDRTPDRSAKSLSTPFSLPIPDDDDAFKREQVSSAKSQRTPFILHIIDDDDAFETVNVSSRRKSTANPISKPNPLKSMTAKELEVNPTQNKTSGTKIVKMVPGKTNDNNESTKKQEENSANREKPPRIYVASRTQKQLQQMIKELKEKTDYTPKMVRSYLI